MVKRLGIGGIAIISIMIIIVAVIFGYNIISYYTAQSPDKYFEIIPGSQTKNAVSIVNLGDDVISFSQLTVLVNSKTAFIINPMVTVEPGGIGILRYNPPILGTNLNVIIRGPHNEEAFIVSISDSNTFPVCLDGICDTGENCPTDASICEVPICYTPTCIDGCGQAPLPQGETSDGCDGVCDGEGNCISD